MKTTNYSEVEDLSPTSGSAHIVRVFGLEGNHLPCVAGYTIPSPSLKSIVNEDGEFTGRSANHMGMKCMELGAIGRTSSGPTDQSAKSMWSSVWEVHAPPKVQHTIWRACNNILPNRANLKRRIIMDYICPRCHRDTESNGHLFF
ncbi:hypothetical protein M9H77_22438 [Catharanthus roseus]|uniref:Uncharacterized protein n=1 Tax=Catharanthus roseus TaxID=4058 RepID=A0ACC0AQG7_CATRO|nr:hypothetical protein M9H77_22438 [Catharanthus roseus]